MAVSSTSVGGFAGSVRDDEGDDQLAPGRVGDADHRDVGDPGVRTDRVLDLARVDVVAAADDQLRGAAHEPEVAVVAPGAHVARCGTSRPAVKASAVASGRSQ